MENYGMFFADFIGGLVDNQRDAIEKKCLDQFKIRWIESIDYEDHQIRVECRGGEVIEVEQKEFLDWYNEIAQDEYMPLTQDNIGRRVIDEDFIMFLQIEKGYSRTNFQDPPWENE